MKKIRYLGPSDEVNVAPNGPHRRGEVKEYPDDFGMHLIRTSHRQRFEIVQEDGGAKPTPKKTEPVTEKPEQVKDQAPKKTLFVGKHDKKKGKR